jgi:hypothetical protein
MAVKAGVRSIHLAHLDHQKHLYPLWVVVFWSEVADLHRDIRDPWICAEDWLSKCGSSSCQPSQQCLVDAMNAELSNVPWNVQMEGFTHPDPTHKLVRFFRTTWLSNDQMNQQLDLLRRHVKGSQQALTFELVSLDFTDKLLQVYENHDEPSRPYSTS